jgi:hypothetical protein
MGTYRPSHVKLGPKTRNQATGPWSLGHHYSTTATRDQQSRLWLQAGNAMETMEIPKGSAQRSCLIAS